LPPRRLEAFGAAEVRIVDILPFETGNVVEQQREAGPVSGRVSGRRDAAQVREIAGVERDDAIESVEVLRRNLTGTIGGNVDTVALRQEPVPAESTAMFSPAFSASWRSAASASGERQILPRQTNRTDGVWGMCPA